MLGGGVKLFAFYLYAVDFFDCPHFFDLVTEAASFTVPLQGFALTYLYRR
jgi:hypothetical protein